MPKRSALEKLPISNDPADRANERIATHLGILLATVRGQLIAMRDAPDLMERQVASAMLHTTAAKISAVANLHRQLANAKPGISIDLGSLLVETADEIAGALAATGMLNIRQKVTPDCLVDADQASMLVLVLCEIVTKAVRIAMPVQLPVDLWITCARSTDGATVLEIAHDGIDLCDEYEDSRSSRSGEKLIRTLAQRVGAEVTVDVSGSTVSYLLKVASRLAM